ncbi:hypothetical protein CK501_12255 [Halovibrio salipaludis]|uniref:Uncharacterized protein n=1 Tax=Halovibrio salipaludis TaxID=2032626 RepID=A0A2A2F5F0_9GAMM|nr:hypothetical protein [Halovibrio salipaludis]PAU79964.1 hypothetical protein CK501_12255 [Halovibrio salipaludis]
MDERLRRYYLTALGIEPWCARWPLPGAAPSPESPAEPVMAVQPDKPVVSKAKGATRPPPQPALEGQGVSLDAVRQALGSGDDTETAEPAVEEAPETDASSTAVAAQQAFAAMIWHGERFSLAASAAGEFPYEAGNRLGLNILRALDEAVQEEAIFFRWPPFDNPELPGSDDATFEYVLERLMRGSPSRQWIILGEEVRTAVASALSSKGHAVVMSSEQTLGELLAEPAAKRSLWERMKPLVGRDRSQ